MSKVAIGKIINTCGLKGEVKVLNLSDFEKDRYKKGNIVNVTNDSDINEKYTINNIRKHDKFIYVTFKEVNSINEAENLKECMILIDSENIRKDNEDLFYHYELMNMSVFYNGKKIGTISEVTSNGVQDLVRVELNNNNSFLVPFLDEFIDSIDVEKKEIVMKNIEGLL